MTEKATWKDCKTEHPELGRKVLCNKWGDLYVALRLEDDYFCFPFLSSEFSEHLLQPDMWASIDFPPGMHGRFLMIPAGGDELLTMTRYREQFYDEYMEFYNKLVVAAKKGGDE